MTQTIDPAKLKEAAEHLEWVLKQYPDSEDVQSLLRALKPLLDEAKAGRVLQPVDRRDIPGAYNFADGRYVDFTDPDVDDAYVGFSIEMRGGLTEQEKRINARMDAMRKAKTEEPRS
ncbi:hypothetical protein [Dyella lutea]|uniref:Uncharacterized protein n=1 Tax=Dyella lutea TaxID=2950441 RepID=A0ABT1FG23_9GAMM|nr:hypothetical protein [Dyella lutea]MCP1376343.1 hypothetical protein [Dyella lutea]